MIIKSQTLLHEFEFYLIRFLIIIHHLVVRSSFVLERICVVWTFETSRKFRKEKKKIQQNVSLYNSISVATAEDSDSPVAMKLKKMWLKTPVSEEQAAQAVLDPAIGNYHIK